MKKIISTLCSLLITSSVFAKETILVIGDSLSAGFGVETHHEWPTLLEERLKNEKYDYQVINTSVSGETLTWGIQNLPAAIREYQPNMIIIELGINDGLLKLPLASIKHNLIQLIKIAKTAKGKVLLLGVHLPSDNVLYKQNFESLFYDVAKQERVSFVSNFLENVDGHPQLKQPDGLHPTTVAQIVILNNVWPYVKKLLDK